MIALTTDPSQLAQESARTRPLYRAFWVAILIGLIWVGVTAHPQNVESVIGAASVSFTALLPLHLWVARKVCGLPLFPIYAVTHIWAYALPLLYEHPIVAQFGPANQLIGGLTVAAYLLVGTVIWYYISKLPQRSARRVLALNAERADFLFFTMLVAGVAFTIATSAGVIVLSAQVFAIVRAVVLALEVIACFLLSFRYGSKDLHPALGVPFVVAVLALVVVSLPGLLMVNAMSVCAVAALGYTLGARRFPWVVAGVIVVVFAFLHLGKSQMRDEYWTEEEGRREVTPPEYPAFFGEWISISAQHLFGGVGSELDEGQSLMERASLMQLLLYVQLLTPDTAPYLDGATYSIIPGLLVPRILNPAKPASHEGTYILNIHYGFQTREDVEKTTIGFGLLNESYANFGFPGMIMLAVVMASFYAYVARLARNVPVLSLRAIFAALVASYSFQTEFAAGVYVSALFQSTVALAAVAIIFMRPQDVNPNDKLLLD